MGFDAFHGLPLTVSEVNTESLTRMLGSRYFGTEVVSLTVGPILPGTCTKMMLELGYNAAGYAHGLPERLCLKAALDGHGLAGNVSQREVWFYSHMAGHVGGLLPTCYFAARNDRQAVLLLEDLRIRNARFATAADAASVEQVTHLLRALAQLHGRFWDRNTLDPLASETPRTSGCAVLDFSDQVLYQPANFERVLTLPRCAGIPASLRDLGRARHYLERLIGHFGAGPRCLMHGDAHLGNTFCLPGSAAVGYLDWQTFAWGHWAFDVAHLLCTALEAPERRLHEENLLSLYLEALEHNGGTNPGFDAAWLAYRRMAFYGYAWALCPPELQREDVCQTCTHRVVAAIDELGTLEALDTPVATAQ